MNNIRTLIVDDASFIRKMLMQILKRSEFEVVGEAENADEAMLRYEELTPDLVIMDIMMPGTSGIEAVTELRRKHPDALIVMCSALGLESVMKQALDAGARDYIIKPFMPDQVLQKLREVV
jgi:two-component system, chemotaxis family, chemotaxis protein CheY